MRVAGPAGMIAPHDQEVGQARVEYCKSCYNQMLCQLRVAP